MQLTKWSEFELLRDLRLAQSRAALHLFDFHFWAKAASPTRLSLSLFAMVWKSEQPVGI